MATETKKAPAKTADKAATNGNGSATGFELKKVSTAAIRETISSVRAKSGNRTSKYLPVANWVEENIKTEDDGLEIMLDKNEVGGLRGYLRRRFKDRFVVESVTAEKGGDKYITYVRLATEEDKKAEAAKATAEEAAPANAEDQPPVEA